MNSPFVDLTGSRIQAAKSFARQFSQFEWEYLCSCQWFLTGMDHALETGDFFQLNIRAQQTLLDDKIRPRWKVGKDLYHAPASSFES